jgi:PAS domain S-box-containing protein
MKNKTSKQDTAAHHEFRRRTDIDRTRVNTSGEAELRIAIEATGLGIFDYYPLIDELHWSHKAKEHFGLSPDAHVNYNVFLVGLHPQDRERVDRLLHDALQRENEGKYNTEYRTIGIEDRKERWIAARGQVFFNGKGEAVRLIGITLDITEHKRADEELKRTMEALERRNKELQEFRNTAPSGQEQ